MNNVTKKWLFLKASSVVLIPLMCWFILNLVSIFDKDYIDVVSFFSNQPSTRDTVTSSESNLLLFCSAIV